MATHSTSRTSPQTWPSRSTAIGPAPSPRPWGASAPPASTSTATARWVASCTCSSTDLVATRKCLSEAGLREVQEQDVVVIPVHDEPGAAAKIFQRIADAHINVRYSYLATGNRLVIAAPDPQAVLKAIAG